MPTNGRHHHNANAATHAEERKPRTRPGHGDWIEGVLTAIDAPHSLVMVRVENSGRPTVHAGDEVKLSVANSIFKCAEVHGTPTASDLMPGDVLRVDLESGSINNSGARTAGSSEQSVGDQLIAHRVVRTGGVGPAAI